jgi:hypothetical protein
MHKNLQYVKIIFLKDIKVENKDIINADFLHVIKKY